MNCENCGVGVSQEYTYAISSNQCPKCGKTIMGSDRLASFLSLQGLLRNNFKDLDAEKVASLVVSNFELKQIFREELPKEGLIKVKSETVEVEEDDKTSDNEYKKRQIAEAKVKLKEMRDIALDSDPDMRDEILNEAIADQWGLGNANGIMTQEDIRIMADKEKKRQIQENIISGSQGAFRRGS